MKNIKMKQIRNRPASWKSEVSGGIKQLWCHHTSSLHLRPDVSFDGQPDRILTGQVDQRSLRSMLR